MSVDEFAGQCLTNILHQFARELVETKNVRGVEYIYEKQRRRLIGKVLRYADHPKMAWYFPHGAIHTNTLAHKRDPAF